LAGVFAFAVLFFFLICGALKAMNEASKQLGLEGPDRILGYLEATRLVGVSRDTLLREAKRGQLRIMRLTARRAGIQLSELRRWLEGRKGIYDADAA
jgi:hypothetical protein